MPKFNSAKIQKLRKLDNFFRKLLFFKRVKIYPAIVRDNVNEMIILCMYLIGDTIMFIPSLKVLKRNFPNTKITIVCGKPEETILRNLGLVDKFIIVKCPWMSFDYSLKNIIGFFSKLREINKKRYDLAIDFRGDWRNIFFMNFFRSSRKISYNFTGGDYMLTDVIAPDPSITHYIEESFYLLKQIGCEFSEEDKLPRLTLLKEEREFLLNFKKQNELDNKYVIGIHPGASMEVKKWDEKKYGELIIRLADTYPEAVFIVYEGPNERNTFKLIEDVLINNNINFIIVNENLPRYISLLSLCQLVVCNDSGAAHIACAFSLPAVVIYGNVDPSLVSPYGSTMLKIVSHNLNCKPCHQSFCKFGNNLCISIVTVDDVFHDACSIIKLTINAVERA